MITRPSAGLAIPGRGYSEITGLAWSGGGAIRRVEVSTDGGTQLEGSKASDAGAFRRRIPDFTFDWTWNGEEAVIHVSLHG